MIKGSAKFFFLNFASNVIFMYSVKLFISIIFTFLSLPSYFPQTKLRSIFSRFDFSFQDSFICTLYISFFCEHATQLGRINSRTGYIAPKLPVIRDWPSYVRHDANPQSDKKKSVRDTYDSKLAQRMVLYFALGGTRGTRIFSRSQVVTAIASRHDFSQSIYCILHYYLPRLLKQSHFLYQ